MNAALRIAAAAVAVLLPIAALAENHGRVTGSHEVVVGVIDPVGDVDDFVFDAGPGFKVSAAVKAAKGADLVPLLDLIAPDGSVETREIKIKTSKKSAKVTATLLEEGRYGMRVQGASGSGGFSLKWKLKQAKVGKVKKDPMASNTTRLYPFSATGGALVSWAMSFTGVGDATVTRILDPDGVEVPFDEDLVIHSPKGTSEKAKDIPLTGPGGLYNLEVSNVLGESAINLAVKVKLPKLPKETVELTAVEPVLEEVSPVHGGCGQKATLTGQNLGGAPQAVFFGPNPATNLQVVNAQTATCTIPAGSGPVDVTFVAADGQASFAAGAFTFDPLPTISSFSPVEGSNSGGTLLTLTGTGFLTGAPDIYRVVVGGVDASKVQVVDSNTVTCETPAHVSGPKTVKLVNNCGEEVQAPGTFTYGLGMFISNVVPTASPTFGGIPLQIFGAGFQASDEVSIDGQLVSSTPIMSGASVVGHAVASVPAHAVGAVDLKVQRTNGPDPKPAAVRAGGFAYYGFTDITASAIPTATATDDWGGVSAAALDKDGNGTVDWLVIVHTTDLSGSRPGIRMLENNGSGVFTDRTATSMPTITTPGEFAGNAVVSGRFNGDAFPDVYLSRPGTGNEAKTNGASSDYVIPWGRLLFPDQNGVFASQPTTGQGAMFGIAGIPHCAICGSGSKCNLFDFDFRSDFAATGDLDGDFDQDVVLLNNVSIKRFKGTGTLAIYYSCGGVVQYSGYQTYNYGSAVRILATGSNGGMTDRTKDFIGPGGYTASDDLRATNASVVDITGDFLNDIVITFNTGLPPGGGNPLACTRVLRQQNSGSSVSFQKLNNFLPAVSSGTDDDWRGDSVVGGDINNDSYKDLVIALDGAVPNGRTYSTRILIQNSATAKLEDKTDAILAGVLPEGDTARAKFVFMRDIDKDGDQDLIISTPSSTGTGNRRTRLLINTGRDGAGLPILVDASSLFPAESSDPGNAVQVIVGDVDGDGDNDLILVDTHVVSGTTKRTRVWRQDR